ncbi:phosphate:sodium symporter [Polaribacter reichenbachii]|uniref:Phosphate transporter n=1 Tax=Polaribacter reichenbachii TaxID=996801 RepID=A0A1B8U640_9FLAO|nr:inorganic phosphate transporter [Polaribacter reichenbachii]APZ45995.1 phosphate:sodium symporter [Polaribacter reichenbachii]AUC19857.1 phosphate:sodium symporter [Polaribacter reichenbachii]OBY67288.1 phosphate:sodium symporter [Polaribacter reichenbachii]
MEDPYILMLIALAVLAIVDLVVGVSNDAVNFLNSAIGSKAISIRNIMIIASVGVFFGAVSSSGMMEVARKGIFNPDMFVFQDVMYIFMAVMITDILLLDVFNSLGMPTSTTVSIVFELLGSAVVIAIIKISQNDTESMSAIWNYINYNTATDIILGILLSVIVAFTVGAIVQYFSRVIYSFNFESRPAYINSLFGGFAITAITYFIIIKGLKGTQFYGSLKGYLEGNTIQIIAISFVVWTIISHLIIKILKQSILVIIIGVGTFSLAMAFAGNDLVNFIGVPIAALNSYEAWTVSGTNPELFSMGSLAKKVPSNIWLLLLAGGIMVITLWTSSKAKSVIETGINLSRQGEGHEKFQPNNLSRVVVRFAMVLNIGINYLLPQKAQKYINAKFEKPIIKLPKDKTFEMPAFDLVRASVNLIMASVLISIATSMKLPLSTTYVTFMVAMGTSLADRAWGRESAVYRVAGVLNVIGGWFLTAIIAFVAAGIVTYFINLHIAFIPVLLFLVAFLITKNSMAHRKRAKEIKRKTHIERSELITINGVIEESSDHISGVADRINKLYTNVVDDLANHDLNKLRKTDKHVEKLNHEIDELKDNVFYFIKSLDETSVQASKFYISVLGYLQDSAQSISYISRASFKHVNNNHKNLKKGQLKDLKGINNQLTEILQNVSDVFKSRDFDSLNPILIEKRELLKNVSLSVEKQVSRIRTDETSPKNSTLYFSILLETKDLMKALMNLLEIYEEFYLSTK